MMLLSILIPTKDRHFQLNSLLSSLRHLIDKHNLRNEVEIIISNNSQQNIEVESDIVNRILDTRGAYLTAEENLFSLLKHANGKYLWVLGDDEIPINHGFAKLIQLCQEEKYEAMVFNSRVLGIEGEPLGHSRISLNQNELVIPYTNFLERTGCWSIAAGISHTIFRNDLNNFEYIRRISLLSSPIYSHVTYYACIFQNKEFAFVNYDLVHYQTNKHDVIKAKNNHWKIHAKEQKYFYRYPWTLGFIRQLKFLENEGIIRSDFFDNILDISHFGRRFKLAENCLALFIEQRVLELENPRILKIGSGDFQEMTSYLMDHLPRYARTYELLTRTVDSNKNMSSKEKLKELSVHLHFLKFSWERLPFYGFYRFLKNHFLYFQTPLGWIAIKPDLNNLDSEYISNNNSNILDGSLNQKLIWALGGLEIPSDFEYHAQSLFDLENVISSETKNTKSNLGKEIAFFLAPEKFANNIYSNFSRARRIYGKLPKFVKRVLKRYLFE